MFSLMSVLSIYEILDALYNMCLHTKLKQHIQAVLSWLDVAYVLK